MTILKFSLTFLLDIQLFYSFHSARDQDVTISFFSPSKLLSAPLDNEKQCKY